jgi:hypothetical protein
VNLRKDHYRVLACVFVTATAKELHVTTTRALPRRHRCLYLVRESCGVPRPIVAVVVQTTTMTIGESNDDERGSSSFVGGDGSKNCGPV